MNDGEVLKLLMEIKSELQKQNEILNDIKSVLQEDRKMMWRVLIMTIIGAFLLVGVKLMLPS